MSGVLSALCALGVTVVSCSVTSDSNRLPDTADASAPQILSVAEALAPTNTVVSGVAGVATERVSHVRAVEGRFVETPAGARAPRGAAPVALWPAERMASADPPTTRVAERVIPSPNIPSSPLSASFQALDDNNAFIPPDTDGAVGPNHLVVALNSQIRIQDKVGNTLSTTTLATFFQPLGHTGSLYAPKVIYDSLAGRFIMTVSADPNLTTSAVLLAVSQSTDPTLGWWLYSIPTTGTNFADSPLSGFNKDWIVVSSNLFANTGSAWQGCHVDVFNKAVMYSGAGGAFTRFTTTVAQNDFAMQPALEYDGALATMYLLEEWNGATAQDRLDSIQGPIGAETITLGSIIAMPQGAWSDVPPRTNGGFAPQLGSTNRIDNGDARMRGAVYRNGQLWGTHTVFLPPASPTRSSIQWFSLNPTNATINQSGRIDDGSGVTFYAYPSIAVNRYNDALLGYSRFSASQYASGNYAERFNFDATNTWRDDTVMKAGQAPYFKEFSGTVNRWGDYSMTAVDPSDDATMWTVQEAAATNSGGFDHWVTWWGKLTLDCAGKPNGTGCDSDGLCSGGPKTCQGGVCVGTNPVVCSPLDQCHVAGTCDPTTGACSNPIKGNGTACAGANLCNQTYTCQAGVCTGGNPVVCTASDQCHDIGTCQPASGTCTNPPKSNGSGCNDGNACTQNDTCQNGACAGGGPVVCTAIDQCHTAGTCNPANGTCTNPVKSDGSACTGANLCNQSYTCQAGTCTGANPVVCTASDQCHDVGTCQAASGTCTNPPKVNGTVCTDGNACTQNDTCQNGACTGGNPVICTAMDQCHVAGTCNAVTGTCSNPAKGDGTACTGSNQCNRSYSCQAGTCTGANPVVCTASDQCHDSGICNAANGVCSNPPKADGTVCVGASACNRTYTCVIGTCTGSNPVVCTPSDTCHLAGTCDPTNGRCSNPVAANGSPCDDGNGCTQTDICQNGACAGSNPIVCTASDTCHVAGTCDPASGRCSNPPAANGTACNDGNACSKNESCQNGVCSGTAVVCPRSDTCHTGTCDTKTGACSDTPLADGSRCDDGNLCTTGDICTGATCMGTAVKCAPPDACHDPGTCDPNSGSCAYPAKANGTPCPNGACQLGRCVPSGKDGGADVDGSAADGGGDTPSQNGGCGCRTAEPRTSTSDLALAGFGALAMIGGLRLRRRARK